MYYTPVDARCITPPRGRGSVDTDLPLLDSFLQQAHPDGGWGYAPGQAPQLEPTCLGLLALALDPERCTTQIAAGRALVEQAARPDGSYRPIAGRDEAIWPTALVLFVRRRPR